MKEDMKEWFWRSVFFVLLMAFFLGVTWGLASIDSLINPWLRSSIPMHWYNFFTTVHYTGYLYAHHRPVWIFPALLQSALGAFMMMARIMLRS
jgi:hypothetical protein